jgi:hypothetical protein
MAICHRRHSTAGVRSGDRATGCIRRARERSGADPAAPLTLGDLANEAGLSRYQLLRAFARELGLTPHAYILQRRIAFVTSWSTSLGATAHSRGTRARRSCGHYRRHGFELVSPEQKAVLLRKYWTIPERQIETSVVLANPSYAERNVDRS